MAQDSKRKRRERRLRRDRNIALKMAQVAIYQREQARSIANNLATKLAEARPKVTITPVEEPEIGTADTESIPAEASGSNENSSGLEVPEGEVLGV